MGWTIGWDTREELVEELTRSRETAGGKAVLLGKFFSGNDMWTAWEVVKNRSPMESLAAQALDDPELAARKERFICLFKLDGGRNKQWGYKPIDEAMGPVETSCPLKFLDMVPPVEGDVTQNGPAKWSKEWREHVREYWKARAARRRKRIA